MCGCVGEWVGGWVGGWVSGWVTNWFCHQLKELSHRLRVCTGGSVLYFNTRPTSVFQITHI